MSIRVSRPDRLRAATSSVVVRACSAWRSTIAHASACLDRKWKYRAPLVTSASARMSSRLTRLYGVRANCRDAACRIWSRVRSARRSSCSVTTQPRNLQDCIVGRTSRGKRAYLDCSIRNFPCGHAGNRVSMSVFRSARECEYLKSPLGVQIILSVCILLYVITPGSPPVSPAASDRAPAAGPATNHAPSPSAVVRGYPECVAMACTGNPPRIPVQVMVTSLTRYPFGDSATARSLGAACGQRMLSSSGRSTSLAAVTALTR